MKRLFFGIAALALSAAAFLPAQAMAEVNLSFLIGSPPPPTRYEVVPAPRRGYTWIGGYWDWSGRRHVWREGHWERVRPGYVYHHPEWRQEHGKWVLYKHGWERSRYEKRHDRDDDDHDRHHRRHHDDD